MKQLLIVLSEINTSKANWRKVVISIINCMRFNLAFPSLVISSKILQGLKRVKKKSNCFNKIHTFMEEKKIEFSVHYTIMFRILGFWGLVCSLVCFFVKQCCTKGCLLIAWNYISILHHFGKVNHPTIKSSLLPRWLFHALWTIKRRLLKRNFCELYELCPEEGLIKILT